MVAIAKQLKLLPHALSYEALREHYEIEKVLASRLRDSSREERAHLYTELYEELFRRVPHLKDVADCRADQQVDAAMATLEPYLGKDATFLEVGPGNCALAFEVAKRVQRVIAVDVASNIVPPGRAPENFQLVQSNGVSIDVVEGSVDVIFSDQLMEHVHPEDAIEQLKNIHKALKPGGHYCCITPSRLLGPWDISLCFDLEARGMHLKEYTATELRELLLLVGFSNVFSVAVWKTRRWELPIHITMALEKVVTLLPPTLARKRALLASRLALLLGLPIVARKRA